MLSDAEKSDLLRALASVFEETEANGEQSPDDPNERRRTEFLLEKIRRRGITGRLDENVHPSHIAEKLRTESVAARNLILRNLPPDLSARLAVNLELIGRAEDFTPPVAEREIRPDIAALVKQKFLGHLKSSEDIADPEPIDRFSGAELETFIRHLGLREIALVCRGINSKETLAAFLNRFEQNDAREIALYITELDNVKPFRVAQANDLIRQIWGEDLPADKVVRRTGMHLLAEAFVARDETSAQYTAYKLSVRESKNWLRLVDQIRGEISTTDERENLRAVRRRKSFAAAAVKFTETGRL